MKSRTFVTSEIGMKDKKKLKKDKYSGEGDM